MDALSPRTLPNYVSGATLSGGWRMIVAQPSQLPATTADSSSLSSPPRLALLTGQAQPPETGGTVTRTYHGNAITAVGQS